MGKKNVARVSVPIKNKHNQQWKNFNDMLREFKRRVDDSGILHEYKEHSTFESKSEKARKKKKEAQKNRRMENLEKKILAGERVKAPSGVIRKINASINKRRAKK